MQKLTNKINFLFILYLMIPFLTIILVLFFVSYNIYSLDIDDKNPDFNMILNWFYYKIIANWDIVCLPSLLFFSIYTGINLKKVNKQINIIHFLIIISFASTSIYTISFKYSGANFKSRTQMTAILNLPEKTDLIDVYNEYKNTPPFCDLVIWIKEKQKTKTELTKNLEYNKKINNEIYNRVMPILLIIFISIIGFLIGKILSRKFSQIIRLVIIWILLPLLFLLLIFYTFSKINLDNCELLTIYPIITLILLIIDFENKKDRIKEFEVLV